MWQNYNCFICTEIAAVVLWDTSSKSGPMRKLPNLPLKLSHTCRAHETKDPSVHSVTTHSLGWELKILKGGETKRNKDIDVTQKMLKPVLSCLPKPSKTVYTRPVRTEVSAEAKPALRSEL